MEVGAEEGREQAYLLHCQGHYIDAEASEPKKKKNEDKVEVYVNEKTLVGRSGYISERVARGQRKCCPDITNLS